MRASNFQSLWAFYRERAEHALADRLPIATDSESPPQLCEAMRYVCLNGGKRLRAMLVYAFGEMTGAHLSQLDAPAAAVEMVHAYSLVHDDLPAMDDDALRRGRETCHIKYDEATAILVGDALQARAFEVLVADPALDDGDAPVSAEQRVKMMQILARALGVGGMVGGQFLDVREAANADADSDSVTQVDLRALQRMHHMKTGALIRACANLGCLTAPPARVSDSLLRAVDDYAAQLGLAFQIVDDVLDVESGSETLGKPSGSDQRLQKTTSASLLGVRGARARAARLGEKARKIADEIMEILAMGRNRDSANSNRGDIIGGAFLHQLVGFVEQRSF